MRRTLTLHPDSRCGAVTGIEVEIGRPRPGQLVLRYVVAGRIHDLKLVPAAAPARGDELWRHTCFEAFVRAPPSAAYYEFNFAPSLQWAAYRFGGYRTEKSVVSEMSAPRLDAQSNAHGYRLSAALELDPLPDLPADADWRLAVSAVIEEVGGCLSYWALAHPPGRADFHHSDCFVQELPAP